MFVPSNVENTAIKCTNPMPQKDEHYVEKIFPGKDYIFSAYLAIFEHIVCKIYVSMVIKPHFAVYPNR